MIDWWGLARNALWILGLSVCLATLSMVSFRARAEQSRLREALSKPGTELTLAFGLLLFSLGMLATSRSWGQALVSGLLFVLVSGQIIHLWSRGRKES
jgi:hypothetical protein